MKRAPLSVLLAFWCIVFTTPYLLAHEKLNPKDHESHSLFTLDDASLPTKNAFAELTNEFFSGQTRALKILFTSEPMTDEARADILNDDARTMRKKDHAYLVLFIDKTNKIWQVNLTIVMRGKTVARTVAWKPEELKQFSSMFSYDGKRLQLKSKGTFKESSLNLGWDVSLDTPVFDRVASKTK